MLKKLSSYSLFLFIGRWSGAERQSLWSNSHPRRKSAAQHERQRHRMEEYRHQRVNFFKARYKKSQSIFVWLAAWLAMTTTTVTTSEDENIWWKAQAEKKKRFFKSSTLLRFFLCTCIIFNVFQRDSGDEQPQCIWELSYGFAHELRTVAALDDEWCW